MNALPISDNIAPDKQDSDKVILAADLFSQLSPKAQESIIDLIRCLLSAQ